MHPVLVSFLVLVLVNSVSRIFIWIYKRWLAQGSSEHSGKTVPDYDASDSHPSFAIELRSDRQPLPASEPEALSTSLHTGKKRHMHKIISAVTEYVQSFAGQ
jgi:hypothetical protein